jgi:hypothetical protein
MDNLHSNLAKIWMWFVSIAWYQKRLVSLNEFSFSVRTTPIGRFFKAYRGVHEPIRHPNACFLRDKV